MRSRLLCVSKFNNFIDSLDDVSNKRKHCFGSESASSSKQPKTVYPAYFIPELAHVVAMCDEKLPFVALAQEVIEKQIHVLFIQLLKSSFRLF